MCLQFPEQVTGEIKSRPRALVSRFSVHPYISLRSLFIKQFLPLSMKYYLTGAKTNWLHLFYVLL